MAAARRTGNEDPGGWKEGRVPARGAGRLRRQAVAGALSAAGLVAAALSLALVLAAPAGSAGATTTRGKTVKVSTAKVSGVGTVLTTASGLTLYRFADDPKGMATCTGACAKIWPPLLAGKGSHVSGPKGVKGLSLISVANGHWQVAFHDVALYRFEGDKKKGQAQGQNVGKVWFAVLKSGIPAATAAAPAVTPTTAPGASTTQPMTSTTQGSHSGTGSSSGSGSGSGSNAPAPAPAPAQTPVTQATTPPTSPPTTPATTPPTSPPTTPPTSPPTTTTTAPPPSGGAGF
jgi:predicted lipoprotein with Yx(FWY)xxD motif